MKKFALESLFRKTDYSIRILLFLVVTGMSGIHGSLLLADEFRAYPATIVFNETEGNVSGARRLIYLFSSTDGSAMNWSLTKNASWINTDLTSGVTPNVLMVSVNTVNLQHGTYNGNVVLHSPQSTAADVNISVTLIINPDVGVTITPWKKGYSGAMSVSVDDSYGSDFDVLSANGFSGTYVMWDVNPPSFYTAYYNAGMELGCHTVNHPCFSVSDTRLRSTELEPNISGLCTRTPQPCKDVISFVWPCGYTNYREQAIASEYFLSSRGYNINQLEDQEPENFMNLKSYNSHEHTPYPPSDFKTLVDLAINQKKWFNLVLHSLNNDDGAVTYASTRNIWVTSIGNVIKYILQRDRFILTDYITGADNVTFKVSRLSVPSSRYRSFENAFGPNDVSTMKIDIDDSRTLENVLINGVPNPYTLLTINGNIVLLTDVSLSAANTKVVEVRYLSTGRIYLTVSGVTADNKVYDGTTAADLNTSGAVLVGVQEGDTVSLVTSGAFGIFTNKNVGMNKTVMTSGFTLVGANADKYSLIQPTVTANVSAVGLTVRGVTASGKVYDGTRTAVLNTGSAYLSGILPGDFVTLFKTNASGTFSSKNVGTSKTVTISGFSLTGLDAGNYTLSQPGATAGITAASLTITGVTANNKDYDGNTSATLNTSGAALSGIIAGDAVTLVTDGATGTFDNANSGTGKIVSTSGFAITGDDSGNYSLTQPTTTANIIGVTITVSGVTANDRSYNGTVAATLNTGSAILVGVSPGDAVSLVRTGATGTFSNKNVGASKVVTTTGFTLSGSQAGKYSLIQPTTSASITPAVLTVSGVTANNKVYDGNTSATINTSGSVLAGVFSGDAVTLVSTGATGSFNNKNAGVAKPVTISGLTLSGTDSGNYTLTQPVATATVTAASLTISGVTAGSRVYNATTSAVLNTSGALLSGVVGGDAVTLVSTGASGAFSNKHAATGKTVITTGFSIGGADAANYSLVQPTPLASITPAPLTISGVAANNKVYNGTVAASVNGSGASLAGVFAGDVVSPSFSSAGGTFADKNAGTGKAVTVSGITLTGSDAGNYTLTQPAATANITRAPLVITGLTAADKIYDGTTAAVLNTTGATLSVVFGSDNVSLLTSGASGTYSDENAGSGKTVTTSGFSIGGTDASNYLLSQPTLTAGILLRTLTVTANDLNKPYKTVLTFTGKEYTYSGLVAGDVLPSFTISSPGAAMEASPGQYVITITGGTLSNYSIEYVNGNLSVAKYVLNARADDKTKVFGSANPPLTITYKGFVNGDTPSVLDVPPAISTTASAASSPGHYGITLSGGADDLYDLKLENGTMDVEKAPLVVTGDNKSKIYGGINPELTVSYSGFLPGDDQSVLDELPTVESIVDEHSDAGDYAIEVSGGSDRNYGFIYQDGIFTVEKADQVLSFSTISGQLRMTQQVELEASSSVGLPVSFSLSDPGKGSVNGNILTLAKDGKLTISAIQQGDHNHKAAMPVSQTIDVLPTFDNISSLFTPNGDGMNDYWYIPDLEEYGNVKVTVYNRYGQKVYEADSYKNDWDGTWNGSPLPSASYYYVIKSEKKGFIKGVVNLVR